MSSRLADRLNAAQQYFFVGRAGELETFQSAISAEKLPFYMLYIHGPGGVGKTTLLKQFIEVCRAVGVPAVYLDARHIDPSPASFQASLQAAMGLAPPASLLDELAGREERCVLLIDTYETLAPLDEWICTQFLVHLSDNILVVLAGRLPPSMAWRADPAWQSMLSNIALRNLDPDSSRAYLDKRNVPQDQQQEVMNFTHGHPLALSLVADVFAQRKNASFVPEETPDIVKTLVEQFVQKVPGPAHRTALEACALVRVLTEGLLSAMLENSEVHELFDWLRGLSFIEFRRSGLFPHDLAREALVTDLRWRNPDWFHELKRRARKYYASHLAEAGPQMQQRLLLDYVYLHRDNSMVRPFFEWQDGGSALADAMQPSDQPALLSMVEEHEGADSARLAKFWFTRSPEDVLVLRGAEGQPAGFLMLLQLQGLPEESIRFDPAVQASINYLRAHAPLRSAERATLFRFWMAKDTYQSVSPIQSLIFIQMVRHYLTTPGLAFIFIPCADPDFWMPIFAYGDLHRLAEADFSVDEHTYGVYGHDWRVLPPMAWLDLMAERENAVGLQPVALSTASEPLIVLSQEDFFDAVREALKGFVNPNKLTGNPLLCSRLLATNGGLELKRSERVSKLQEIILQAVASLHASSRTEKFYRALDQTYFHPQATQESAAEALDLPFSTYRRHLKTGIELVSEILWEREIGGV